MLTTSQLASVAEALARLDGLGDQFLLDSSDPGHIHGHYVHYFRRARELMDELERKGLHIEAFGKAKVMPF